MRGPEDGINMIFKGRERGQAEQRGVNIENTEETGTYHQHP
jgi:hypothetical protein